MRINFYNIVILLVMGLFLLDFKENLSSGISEELVPFLALWEKDTGITVHLRTIRLGELKEGIAGTCWILNRKIIIDKDVWDRSDFYSRKELLYHELGHCVLLRMHNNSTFQNGCPKSIMYDTMFSTEQLRCYINNESYYIEELLK